MRFKKVYIEITNICNLNCSFCNNNKRKKEYMSLENFKCIIQEVRPYTNYIYLHVKGEPLLHPDLKGILEVCEENNMQVNITTNGTLLKQKQNVLANSKCIRQLNISLHSENEISTYFEDIFNAVKVFPKEMYISYRLWTLNNYELDKKSTNIVNKIIKEYNLSPVTVEKLYKEKSVKIDSHIYVNKDNLFQWPTLEKKTKRNSFCYGLKTHIGILVDGTVVPCCLDGEGVISLGNIFYEPLDKILNSKRAKCLLEEFKNNKCSEELCAKCSFKDRFSS